MTTLVIRSGRPEPVRGTAPALGAIPADEAAALPAKFVDEKATFSLRMRNTGANPLRVYFDPPWLSENFTDKFIEIAAAGIVEGLYELDNLWLYGNGGTTTFELLLGRRIT